MAVAIESGGQLYFLARHGHWMEQGYTLQGWTPALGDALSVTGDIQQRHDIRGDPFFLIEVKTLAPAALPD
jgi:hypothetical protein